MNRHTSIHQIGPEACDEGETAEASAAARGQTTNQDYYRLGSVAGLTKAGVGDTFQPSLQGEHPSGNLLGGDSHLLLMWVGLLVAQAAFGLFAFTIFSVLR